MKKWLGLMAIALTVITTACSSGDGETVNEKETAATGEKTTVTLSIQQMTPYYQTLEKKFEEKNPDIDLHIQAYKQIGEKLESADYEKYQKTTNTELLSGKGADIYEVHSLPINEYVDKQLFLNMDDDLEQDQSLNKSDLQTNILDALKLNGGTYLIPSGFSLRAFVGDGDALDGAGVDDKTWTWDSFEAIAKNIMQKEKEEGKEPRYAVASTPPDVFFQEMFVDNYATFVDLEAKKAKFDSPDFVAMMKHVEQMYKDKLMTEEPAEVGKQLFYSTVMQSPADIATNLHTLFNNPMLLQKPHVGEAGGMRIVPNSQYAIRAKSAVTKEAWKFISFLLSEEGQTLEGSEGFSLLKSVNAKALKDVQEQAKSGAYKLPDGKAIEISDEEITQFTTLKNATENYASVDLKVLSILGEEAYAFYSGQKTAEEAAALIQNRATTVLNE